MNKKLRKVFFIVAVVLFLSTIILVFSNNSNAVDIKPEINSNDSGNGNASVMDTIQKTTNDTTKNMISIPLEKPPFIKD